MNHKVQMEKLSVIKNKVRNYTEINNTIDYTHIIQSSLSIRLSANTLTEPSKINAVINWLPCIHSGVTLSPEKYSDSFL